jgi:hypothetical protein
MSPGHGFGPRGGPNLLMVRGFGVGSKITSTERPLPTLPRTGEGLGRRGHVYDE